MCPAYNLGAPLLSLFLFSSLFLPLFFHFQNGLSNSPNCCRPPSSDLITQIVESFFFFYIPFHSSFFYVAVRSTLQILKENPGSIQQHIYHPLPLHPEPHTYFVHSVLASLSPSVLFPVDLPSHLRSVTRTSPPRTTREKKGKEKKRKKNNLHIRFIFATGQVVVIIPYPVPSLLLLLSL